MSSVYITFYKFLFRYRLVFSLFVISVFTLGIVQNIQPYFYKLFIDSLPEANFSKILAILSIYILVRLFEVLFNGLVNTTNDWVLFRASRDVRCAILSHIQELDFAYHLSKSTGGLISLIRRGDGAFFDLNHSLNKRLVQIFIGFVVTVGFFIQIDPMLAIIMVVSLAANLLFAQILVKKNIIARSAFNDSEDNISSLLVDNLINYETVKIFAKEKWEGDRLFNQFNHWISKFWIYANTFRLIDYTVGFIGNLGLFAVLAFGLYKTIHGFITIGDYIMVLGFVSSFYPKFFDLIYELRNLARHQTDIKQYFDILNLVPQVGDPVKPLHLHKFKGDLEFKNVSFVYPDNHKNALKQINLRINGGESIAFVGHSGTGKTTLIKLLLRFYDPTSGQILLDNHDIRRLTKSDLRSRMGVVPQEPVLFNNTIAFNIGYGADNPTQADIKKAAQMAKLDEFIESLPDKYLTQVGERGVRLSGGQKQRLAIARMIIKNPDIIIFDEATSQLDSESEKAIQESFWSYAHGKTTIIIAHRLSTVIKADRIVVMKSGCIHEVGTHKELLTRPQSLYAHFWHLQSSH